MSHFLSESDIEKLINLPDDQFFQLIEIPDGYDSEIGSDSDTEEIEPNMFLTQPSEVQEVQLLELHESARQHTMQLEFEVRFLLLRN